MSEQVSHRRGKVIEDRAPLFARDLPGAPDIAFYSGLAREHGGPVLELGCVKGRVCSAIARAGIDVVGLDIDERSLEVARRTRDALPPPAKTRLLMRHGDMRDASLDRPYALVVLPYRSFQDPATVDDQRLVLDRVREVLAPGGVLALDVFDPDPAALAAASAPDRHQPPSVLHHRDERGWHVTTAFTRTCDLGRQRVREQRTVVVTDDDGAEVSRRSFHLDVRYAFRFEMENLLQAAGFHIQALYGDFEHGDWRPGGEQVWVASVDPR